MGGEGKLLREQMEGMNEDYILEAVFKLRTENTEVHKRIIDYFVNQYDEYTQSSEDGWETASNIKTTSMLLRN